MFTLDVFRIETTSTLADGAIPVERIKRREIESSHQDFMFNDFIPRQSQQYGAISPRFGFGFLSSVLFSSTATTTVVVTVPTSYSFQTTTTTLTVITSLLMIEKCYNIFS